MNNREGRGRSPRPLLSAIQAGTRKRQLLRRENIHESRNRHLLPKGLRSGSVIVSSFLEQKYPRFDQTHPRSPATVSLPHCNSVAFLFWRCPFQTNSTKRRHKFLVIVKSGYWFVFRTLSSTIQKCSAPPDREGRFVPFFDVCPCSASAVFAVPAVFFFFLPN